MSKPEPAVEKDLIATVLYHANCLDGFGAAWAAWESFRGAAKYIPVQYGPENTPTFGDLQGNIYLVDFCYPPKQMVEIGYLAFSRGTKVVVIDHHKTAIEAVAQFDWPEDLASTFEWVLDIKHSGAVLTWNYFHPYEDYMPYGLQLIEDRDLWKFDNPKTKCYCAALAIVPRNFESWHSCLVSQTRMDRLYFEGEVLLRQQEQHLIALEETAYTYQITYTIGAVTTTVYVLACNAPAWYASELGNRLALKSNSGIGMVWQKIARPGVTDTIMQVSLRSVGEVDVEVIAKALGGGGHKHAAGYTLRDK